jgi:hypothetical protein
MYRRFVWVAGILICGIAYSACQKERLSVEEQATADGSTDGGVEVQLDFSGVDGFWEIAEIITRGDEPTVGQWQQLLGTPGYAALTRSEFPPDFFSKAINLALDSTRAAEREALTGGAARIVNHVHDARGRKQELQDWADELRNRGLESVVSRAFELVPASWPREAPMIAFVIFDNDARGYDPIVIDLLASKQRNLNPFLAHECHHWIRNRHLAFDPTLAEGEDEALLWVLNQLQAEGIADRIDKQGWITGEVETPASKASYMDEYMRNLRAAPEHIRQLDAILSGDRKDRSDRSAEGDSLRAVVPQSGHPTGFFMASRIVAVLGEPALVDSAGNPFTFVELYQQAALARPTEAPPFSDQALELIRSLGERIGK